MTKEWDYSISDEKFEELIKDYCTDFTQLEREGRYGPITGREKEIKDALLILLQKGRKNVAFLAPAGVGKTAAVVGLAQEVVKGNVPDYLKNSRVIEIDLARMASGTTSRAEFQDRFLPLCKAVSERYHNPDEPRHILFIDEFHQLMPNCIGSSYAGLADTMKPYLTAGDLMIVAATTLDEFRLYVAEDPAMDRRFQKVFLKTPNAEETYAIMKALSPGLEKHHKVTISKELLMLIVRLTEEHMRKRNQPDKSIITTDSAMAYHVMEHGTGQELTVESVYYMVARETGLNARAMHDERMLEDIKEHVARLEGETEVQEDTTKNKAYDPSQNLKDVEMDKAFQAELNAEREAAQQRIAQSGASDGDKQNELDALEERLAEKLASRVEEKLQVKEA
ncbi:MAG: AAA family ATPase [Alphaproteobacteria bacterium]